MCAVLWPSTSRFLSTPSARRATLDELAFELQEAEISIHALREEGDLAQQTAAAPATISIHALREEGDLSFPWITAEKRRDFYPRPPRGGRQ